MVWGRADLVSCVTCRGFHLGFLGAVNVLARDLLLAFFFLFFLEFVDFISCSTNLDGKMNLMVEKLARKKRRMHVERNNRSLLYVCV